jgi:fused signal recognition particle receptor
MIDSLTSFSLTYGTGNLVQDLALLILGLVIVALAVAIVVVLRGEDSVAPEGFERMTSIGGRVERLEQTVNGSRTELMRTVELLRGEVDSLRATVSTVRSQVQSLLSEGDRRIAIDGDSTEVAPSYITPTGSGTTYPPAKPVSEISSFTTEPPGDALEEITPFDAGILPEPTATPPPAEKSSEIVSGSLSSRLKKTRVGLFEKIKSLFGVKPSLDQDALEELEVLLVSADVGVKTSQGLIEALKAEASAGQELTESNLTALLKSKVLAVLERNAPFDPEIKPTRRENGPLVVMVVGVNGVGKTTTVAKLSHQWKAAGAKVLLVAADTFRAAAVDQLREWGDRIGVPVVSGEPDAKPQTVVYAALDRAEAEQFDVILIDTAGRLHTKANLMQELEGVRNLVERRQPGAPHEVVLVLDGSTGQNAVAQAKEFHDALKLTGLVITKLDGTPKGGVVVAIKNEYGIPVRYIGVGEAPEDLRPFVARDFVEALFDTSAPEEGQLQSAHGESRRRKRRDTQSYL